MRLPLPSLSANEWKSHDSAFKSRLAPIHSALSSDLISPSEAARDFSSTLSDFLGEIDVFKGGEGGGGGRRGGNVDISDEAFLRAKLEKKRLRRLVFGGRQRVDQSLRAQFYQAVKTYSYIRNEREKRARERDMKGQEKSFLKDFWAFSKKAVNGLVGQQAVSRASQKGWF